VEGRNALVSVHSFHEHHYLGHSSSGWDAVPGRLDLDPLLYKEHLETDFRFDGIDSRLCFRVESGDRYKDVGPVFSNCCVSDPQVSYGNLSTNLNASFVAMEVAFVSSIGTNS